MNETKTLKVGDKAPDFSLFDHKQNKFNLSNFSGKKILLSFHPLAWTAVCAEQMKSLEANFETFKGLNTTPLGLSIDTAPSKKEWAKVLGIKNTRLLCDFWPHGKVAKLYGIFRDADGFSERANIIIDENQKIKFIKIYEISKLPDVNEIINELKK